MPKFTVVQEYRYFLSKKQIEKFDTEDELRWKELVDLAKNRGVKEEFLSKFSSTPSKDLAVWLDLYQCAFKYLSDINRPHVKVKTEEETVPDKIVWLIQDKNGDTIFEDGF